MTDVDGIHDVGGMHGFDDLDPESGTPFHADWERTVFAGMLACFVRGEFTVDEMRYAIERMPPAEYLTESYYEKWAGALERLLVEKGRVDGDELAERVAAAESGELDVEDRNDPELVERFREGLGAAYASADDADDATFAEGDAVVVRNQHPAGHVRSPRYVRGKRGRVVAVRGAYSLPDAAAEGREEPAPLYNVAFDGEEVWGDDGEVDTVHVELWEPYLKSDER